MGRNYFSKAGGPYFINDGFSHHQENLNKPSIKPDKKLFYFIVSGFGIVLATIGLLIIL
jgi:hypothetical protein